MSDHPKSPQVRAPNAPIYLDYQATTPTDPRVVEAMLPFFGERFGNPHSVHHAIGWAAEEAVEAARAQIAGLIGAEPREVIFTSGATESNNLAIKGAARFHRAAKPHVVTCVTEHKCVLESCRRLESEGIRVTTLPVRENGLIDLDQLDDALTEETALVTVMAVNNEIGVIQPVAEIGALCRRYGAYFHSDGAQAAGKIPLDVNRLAIDLLSTLPTPLCVGLGTACAIAGREMAEEARRLAGLAQELKDALMERLPGVRLNGDPDQRIPGNLNLSFAGLDGEALIEAMPGIAVSSGSACTSASLEPSYVLRAIGLSDALAGASVRVGLGRFTTADDIDRAAEEIVAAVERLRRGGPRAAE
jgi:cysteine desulfurase